ncbi:member of the karyopherin-beta [Elasticomyces elasticus]|nr:member of the karyopherin-beta [Elasticomyces elasticus]
MEVSAPQSMAEVEQLVKRLYQPEYSHLVTRIQDRLQALQRSPDGWQLGDALLGSDDPNVRFFGALTFTVKLNNDGSEQGPGT